MKILVITASKWEQEEETKEWLRKEWPVKAFYERDKPFAELWVRLHMQDYKWGVDHSEQPFYSMQELELNYV